MEQKITEVLKAISIKLKAELSEDEIERLYQPLYEALGYTTIGGDIRGKKKGDGGIPDVLLLKDDESVHVTVELKKPSETDLSKHEGQILGYMNPLHSKWGLLGNGESIWLYKRENRQVDRLSMHNIQDLIKDPVPLLDLRKPEFEICNFSNVKNSLEEFKSDPVEITTLGAVGAQSFLTSQKMTGSSPFGELILSMYSLLGALNNPASSKFTVGAYEFWDKVYKRPLKQEKAPKLWKSMFSGKFDVSAFMFCLEASYSITSRLLLAKTVQDHDTENKIITDHLTQRMLNHLSNNKKARSDEFDSVEYIEAITKLFDHYAGELFSSIYSQDIFDWWRDYKKAPKQQQVNFAKALGRVLLSMSRFDFTKLDGDILGELYQAYFDPETRKDLGEFYTPPEIVDFILDQCEYKGRGRILDPSCGSGTFLISALKKYLASKQNDDPCEVIRDITSNFPLVGFDVNPFAVMMAQVNFAALLVPVYARAVKKDKSIVIHRLPIIRTDSLRQELIEYAAMNQGKQLGLNMGSEIDVHIELPVKTAQGPLDIKINFPKLENAKESGHILNEREWMRAIQSVFASVQKLGFALDAGTLIPDLSKELRSAIINIGGFQKDRSKSLSKFLFPYAEALWAILQELKIQHDDGRFLKTMEDLMMGVILKHYVKYDYVVGNPPYIRIQKIPSILKSHWENNYDWTDGNYDAFIPFVERSLSGDTAWLDDGGRFGMITSNRFLNTDYASKLREELPKCAEVNCLVNFGASTFKPNNDEKSSRLFKDAMVYPAIIIAAKKDAPRTNYNVNTARFMPKEILECHSTILKKVEASWESLTAKLSYNTVGISSRNPCVDVFLTHSDDLNKDGWFLMPESERPIFNILKSIANEVDDKISDDETIKTRKLNSYTTTNSGTFQGCVTGKDSVFILHDRGLGSSASLRKVWCKEDENIYEIEQALLRPFVEANNIQKWSIVSSTKWMLFPYIQISDGIKVLASIAYKDKTIQRGTKTIKVFDGYHPSEFIEHYPNAWAYLKKHEGCLRDREGKRFDVDNREAWKWYGLSYPKSLEATSASTKILIGNNSKLPVVTIDNAKSFLAGGGTAGVNGVSVAGLEPSYVSGLLGSQVCEFFVKQTSSIFSGGYYSYGDQVLKGLPVPKATKKQREKVSDLVTKLHDESSNLIAIEDNIFQFPESVTESLRKKGIYPNRDTVKNLLTLSKKFPSSFDLSKWSGSKSIQQNINSLATLALSPNAIIEGDLFTAEFVLVYLKNLKSLGCRKLDRKDFESTVIPENETHQKDYLNQLKNWHNDRERYIKSIEDLTISLNKLVMARYGITGKNKKSLLSFIKHY